jgi:hypothetical protein
VAKIRPTVKLERLRGLAGQPQEQVDYALELVETEDNLDVIQAALDALADTPDARVRRTLLDRFTRDADGAGGGDSGCYRRVALLQALRYRAQRDDAAILERGVTTYEFKPPFLPEHIDPTRGDVAAGLRSVALVTLNEVDETLAGYHAARLLVDKYTSPMSGEPAVTAARVLAAQGHTLPLYGYALREESGISEVVGECLRNLTPLPSSLLPALVARYRDSTDEIVLLGLFDLLLAHPDHTRYDDLVLDFLRATRLCNIYRYLASAIVASRREDLAARLQALAAHEPDRTKAEILRDALALR